MLNTACGGGGNLLLNIGPAPDGSLPEEAVNRRISAVVQCLGRGEPLTGAAAIDPKLDVMPSASAGAAQAVFDRLLENEGQGLKSPRRTWTDLPEVPSDHHPELRAHQRGPWQTPSTPHPISPSPFGGNRKLHGAQHSRRTPASKPPMCHPCSCLLRI